MEVGDGFLAGEVLVLNVDVGSHGAEEVEERGAAWVDAGAWQG